jgi:type I restriction enzyme R subunit
MGDDRLRALAQELVRMVRSSVTVDWTLKESARAAIRRDVKRLLRKYGYPPNKELLATDRIIQQAETLCEDWTK